MISGRGSPDGNYGWVVVVAGAVGFSLITGLARVSGFIYVLAIDNFQVSRAKASIIFVVARFVAFAATPIVTKLVTSCTYSILICTGGFVLFVSLMSSAYVTTLWQLVITYGLLIGIGAPLVVTTGILAINTYFKNKRPLALSVYFTIGGMSGLGIPLLFEILLELYGLPGAFMIYSGLMLNICACGLLVTQPDWTTQPLTKDKTLEDKEPIRRASHVRKFSVPAADQSIFQKIITPITTDLHIFKDPVFLVLFTCRVLIMMTLLNVIQFIPDFVENDLRLGLSKRDVAGLLSVTSIGDICARMLPGTVLNKLPWHKKYTYGFLSASVGIFMFLLLAVQSYTLLLVLHVIFGLLLGMLNVMQYILEADLMGPKTPISFGITQLAGGILSVVMMVTVGYIRDITGSYTIGFNLMGISAVLSGLFWLLEPCVVRCLTPKSPNQAD